MTRLYNEYTKEMICELPSSVVGFTICKHDILTIGGNKYRVQNIEHVMEKSLFSNVQTRYLERRILAIPYQTHVLH